MTASADMSDTASRHVAVIGGGIVGVAVAEALLRDGHRVSLIEPGSFGGEQAASYGNGAFISPASVIPMSMPGLWKQVPRYLLDRRGPLTIRLQYLPRLLPWLLRFLWAGHSEARVTRTARALGALLDAAPSRHAGLAARAGVADMLRATGLLYLYTDRAAYAAEGLSWRLRDLCGVRSREVEGDALHDMVPGLAPRYRFAKLLIDGQYCVDPGGYVAAIAHHTMARGMQHIPAQAQGISVSGGQVRAVQTDAGPVPCDTVVVAAGIRSAQFAKALGDHIPMEAERGYHVEFPQMPLKLEIPVMPQDLKVAIVRTAGGVRVAGQVEFASMDAAPDWNRAALLQDKLASCFPDVTATQPNRWQGNRPSIPDGLPVIGASRENADVFYAFGHGHIGLNSAPMTAALIADLVAARPPSINTDPFSPRRFD